MVESRVGEEASTDEATDEAIDEAGDEVLLDMDVLGSAAAVAATTDITLLAASLDITDVADVGVTEIASATAAIEEEPVPYGYAGTVKSLGNGGTAGTDGRETLGTAGTDGTEGSATTATTVGSADACDDSDCVAAERDATDGRSEVDATTTAAAGVSTADPDTADDAETSVTLVTGNSWET
jgi:hypothetical protein